MEKTYNPNAIELAWYQAWEKNGYFAPKSGNRAYCIMLPPPNVTGSLHMGHAFQQTLMDILVRYHRMNGEKTLWQCGTDHAGIATQMVVERQLEQKGKSRHDLGRLKFTDAVWKWKQESGNTITNQSRRLGTSMDWSRERFTMDEKLSDAVTEVFIRLYDEGLIYRGKRLVNWDPVLHTAISDLEVVSKEEDGHLWHIRYPRVDSKDNLVVATTRPETMLGDAAVAVHPDDDRYKDLIGTQVILPLTNRTIPVIADEYVDPEFGPGCVKITPAHDFNDYSIWLRHKDELSTILHGGLINVMNNSAQIISNLSVDEQNPNVANSNQPTLELAQEIIKTLEFIPVDYQGKNRFEVRKKIVADLEKQNFLEIVEAHKLKVPRGDRSHAVIEPYLTDQWYVKIQPLADPAIRAVENGDIKFVPENWAKTFFEWMRNIEDWCISRQLWWGHQIPAWYNDKGRVYVGRSEKEIREKNKLDQNIILTRDEDVLDTWFSSSLWPFSTLGWPDDTDELKTFYPTSVLVTGFDIIFFWVARMIMMGLKFTGKVPFREVYIHGLVRDSEGQKMSKSKGNIIDPLDLIDGVDLDSLIKKRTSELMRPQDAISIEKATRKHYPNGIEAYGTDALRFTFASQATQGRGINFDVGRILGYRNFCNKLWNASRYVMMNIEAQKIDINNGDLEFDLAERWIATRLALTVNQVAECINTYRFDLAAQAIYEFAWDEYCDWYVELSKTTLTDLTASVQKKRGTLYTLINTMEILLRLMHPFTPFITEELWQRIASLLDKGNETIMLQKYPDSSELNSDETSITEMEWLKLFVLAVRRIRSERDIPPGKNLAIQTRGGTADEKSRLDKNNHYVKSLARIESIQEVNIETEDAVVAMAGEMTVLVPLADIINPEAELKKNDNELRQLDIEKQRLIKELNNKSFVERAPATVVEGKRQRLADTEMMITTLTKQQLVYKKLLDR